MISLYKAKDALEHFWSYITFLWMKTFQSIIPKTFGKGWFTSMYCMLDNIYKQQTMNSLKRIFKW